MRVNEEKHTDICQTNSNFNECSLHATCGIDYVIHSKTTFLGKFDISAIPPALSTIGPYASIANCIPTVDNMLIADREIP